MMRIHRRLTVCLAVLVTSVSMTACRTWRPQHLETSTQLVEYNEPIRVTLHDGSKVMLASARISGDSVHGQQRKGTADSTSRMVSLPTRDVRKVEGRQFSTGKTIGAVLATLFMTIVLIGVAAFSSSDGFY